MRSLLFRKRKKREEKLRDALNRHQDFLIERLAQEWDTIQKTAKREELVRRTKDVGLVAGKTLLTLLVIGGVMSVVALSPNLFTVYGRFARRRTFFQKRSWQDATRYLRQKKFIELRGKGRNEKTIHLNSRGLNFTLTKAFRELRIHKPKEWDRMWRIVIFDVPDQDKWMRDEFRRKLKELGFYQMQKSVFVFPYPCENELRFLVDLFSMHRYTRLIRTEFLEGDRDIKDYFGLS